jgi:hypothetical protein
MVNRKIVTIAAILTLVIIIAVAAFISYRYLFIPQGGHKLEFIADYSPINTRDMNVSQGTTLLINVTLSSLSSQQIAMLTVLRLCSYNETVDYGNWYNWQEWNTSIVQERVFNYSFSPNEPTLQPLMSNSTVLTINLAEDAPLGRYYSELIFRIKYIHEDGTSELDNGETHYSLNMIVTPKQE